MAEARKSSKKRKKKPDIIVESGQLKVENDNPSVADGDSVSPAGSVTHGVEESTGLSSTPVRRSATLCTRESKGEGKRQRDERGRFVKGHDRPEGAGFQPGNLESSKYDAKYPEDIKIYFKQIYDEGNYPTFEGYADSIGVTARTLENWCEAHPLFKDAYDFCKNKQRGALLEGAMAGRFNATFAKFVAVNCHGMKEKVESEIKGSGGFKIRVGYLDENEEES